MDVKIASHPHCIYHLPHVPISSQYSSLLQLPSIMSCTDAFRSSGHGVSGRFALAGALAGGSAGGSAGAVSGVLTGFSMTGNASCGAIVTGSVIVFLSADAFVQHVPILQLCQVQYL